VEFDAEPKTFGGKKTKEKDRWFFALNPTELQEIGFMLSMWKDEGFDRRSTRSSWSQSSNLSHGSYSWLNSA
jgi:hypothetical protein